MPYNARLVTVTLESAVCISDVGDVEVQLQEDRIIPCVHAQPVVRCSALHQVHLLKRTTSL